MEDDVVLKHGLIYVPAQDAIKTQVLQAHHDAPLAGHLGQDKTYELISRNYTWPNMRQWVNEYINTCETCIRNKTPRQRPHGPLKPLTIPPGPWKSVSMDFIVELPPSQGHDAIYVCVDRFTKMAHFSATTSAVTAKGTARLFLCDIVRLHGLPADIVSDRGTQFTAKFTKRLLELCDIKGNLSILNPMAKRSASTKSLNNTSASSVTISKTIGTTFYPLRNSPTTMPSTPPPRPPPSTPTMDSTPECRSWTRHAG
jgi:hypothetical protein